MRDELQIDVLHHKEGGILAIDETGFLKKGKQSAGVARQYSSTAGRVENSQIGVFLSYAFKDELMLVDRQLYLPKEWCEDKKRCEQAGIPQEVTFKTKPQLAKMMLQRALSHGIRPSWVVGDEVYGVYELRSYLAEKKIDLIDYTIAETRRLFIYVVKQIRFSLNYLTQIEQFAKMIF